MFPAPAHPQLGEVVTLAATTDAGRRILDEHGDQWLVREIDRSVLSRNLGLLVCPASYQGTERLSPAYDSPRHIVQADGFAMWTKAEGMEVVIP